MAQGIGVRCGAHGVRVLGVERDDGGLRVTAIAATPSASGIHEFVARHVESLDSVSLAYGLGPGDFLTASMRRENGMGESEIREQLLWEIERKVLSNISDYSTDFFFTGDVGFVFAGRKKLIDFLGSAQSSTVYTDVEPVAVLNGCETAGDLDGDTVIIVTIEAEGISSVVMEEDVPLAIDSFPIDENEHTDLLAGLDRKALAEVDIAADDQFVEDVCGSIDRITSFGRNKENPAPMRIILSGPGAYIRNMKTFLEVRYNVPVVLSDPFSVFNNGAEDISPELSDLSAAFTSCLGLALRAMETD